MNTKTMNSNNTVVTLNVGGTIFETQMSTLTKYPGTFFQGVIDSNNQSKYFIDREPSLFKSVLYFLRTGKLETFGTVFRIE